jgi:hypothetical protein
MSENLRPENTGETFKIFDAIKQASYSQNTNRYQYSSVIVDALNDSTFPKDIRKTIVNRYLSLIHDEDWEKVIVTYDIFKKAFDTQNLEYAFGVICRSENVSPRMIQAAYKAKDKRKYGFFDRIGAYITNEKALIEYVNLAEEEAIFRYVVANTKTSLNTIITIHERIQALLSTESLKASYGSGKIIHDPSGIYMPLLIHSSMTDDTFKDILYSLLESKDLRFKLLTWLAEHVVSHHNERVETVWDVYAEYFKHFKSGQNLRYKYDSDEDEYGPAQAFLRKNKTPSWIISEIVGEYGLKDFKTSLSVFNRITRDTEERGHPVLKEDVLFVLRNYSYHVDYYGAEVLFKTKHLTTSELYDFVQNSTLNTLNVRFIKGGLAANYNNHLDRLIKQQGMEGLPENWSIKALNLDGGEWKHIPPF